MTLKLLDYVEGHTHTKAHAFLRAEWRKLILANYEIDPKVLLPYLPFHTELDLWQGRCYVSLVGFMFVNTRVLGIKIPFHINFEEVNLRFYVKAKGLEGSWKRGVVFVKEIVPKAAISIVANSLYKEHYQTMPMRHIWDLGNPLTVSYEWKHKARWNRLSVQAAPEAIPMDPTGEAAFITEHYWGYTKLNHSSTAEYAVEHPSWEIYPVSSYQIDVEMGDIYGPEFKELEQKEPLSVFLAEGSEIIVRRGKRL